MNPISRTPRAVTQPRRGFTLVELLVAVALVLLLMTLFAQIFATATGALSTQRGIAENDQRARRLQTTLASDLSRMTYRALVGTDGIVPILDDNMSGIAWEPVDGLQEGYFYLAENDPNNDTDDVLQFTMQAHGSQIWADTDIPPFVGRALFIPNGDAATELNQPEADDGNLTWNGGAGTLEIALENENSRGASQFAEVVYFLRHGNLYRRMLLVRQQFAPSSSPDHPDLNSVNYGGTNTFWNDFDYSAFFDNDAVTPAMVMLDQNALNNQTGAAISLGMPKYRFGFWGDFQVAESGMPREFTDVAETNFIGRFTHEETSNPNFLYPGQDVAAGNPHMDRLTALNYDAARGIVTDGTATVAGTAPWDLANGTRRSEDIVLSNVHSFDVQVYDPAVGDFVNLGHSIPGGDFNRANNRNVGADGAPGEAGTDDDGINGVDDDGERGWPGTDDYGNRYDTWHRDATLIGDLGSPYAVMTAGPDLAPGVVNFDDNSDGVDDDAGELGWIGTDDVALRAIKITIRYLDTTSNQMRDLTIVHSFADRDSN
ncbi:prepilin-type N-terminal cleavage/methylation domain-containing protein [Symmachiella macrocystis]|nr:prepilin-type N-terminal cleavage/methylation domain-containing protein [Symmachiella macrocystis]